MMPCQGVNSHLLDNNGFDLVGASPRRMCLYVAASVLLQLKRGVGDSCYKSLPSLFPTDVENSFELDK